MCTLVKSAMEVKVENVIGKEKRKDKKIKTQQGRELCEEYLIVATSVMGQFFMVYLARSDLSEIIFNS